MNFRCYSVSKSHDFLAVFLAKSKINQIALLLDDNVIVKVFIHILSLWMIMSEITRIFYLKLKYSRKNE